jgi:hypothetical protein
VGERTAVLLPTMQPAIDLDLKPPESLTKLGLPRVNLSASVRYCRDEIVSPAI